ncbi:MAG: type II toxin-antitoxin system VapC family toxin [Allosphingosinicella sp.]|uniref:type II toxin-antitoxin system VapC family toxin n=1 Tax=Allosphingosinicella sp. TaxID=2823234 RepID=UPI00393E41E2
MRLLLDTQIVLRLVGEIEGKAPSIDDLLDNPANQFLVSVASLWEIAIKVRLGKLPLKLPLAEIAPYLEAGRAELLDVTPAHAIAEVHPAPETKDPFDRLLLAVAMIEGVRLVTVDRSLERHPLAWRSGSA